MGIYRIGAQQQSSKPISHQVWLQLNPQVPQTGGQQRSRCKSWAATNGCGERRPLEKLSIPIWALSKEMRSRLGPGGCQQGLQQQGSFTQKARLQELRKRKLQQVSGQDSNTCQARGTRKKSERKQAPPFCHSERSPSAPESRERMCS